MLKRKHLRFRLLSHGLFLLAAPVTASAKAATGIFQQEPKQQTSSLLSDSLKVIHPNSDTTQTNLQATTAAVTVSAAAPTIPLHPEATLFVRNYIEKNEASLLQLKEKNSRFFTLIDTIFFNLGLPPELKYLAVVESRMQSSALSPMGAAGPWQLMPATARALGLKISSGRDERRHQYKSTKAAALYLKELHENYGDWLLVLAAYNCGPTALNAAIRKAGSRNFWVLQRYLPSETRNHVKRFIGAHYYFEGGGSLATLTRAEAAIYLKKVADYQDRFNQDVIPARETSVYEMRLPESAEK